MVASLPCHDEITACRTCAGWLMKRTGHIDVTPILPVSDMEAAICFYEEAGFDTERYDAGFAFVRSNEIRRLIGSNRYLFSLIGEQPIPDIRDLLAEMYRAPA